MDGCVADVIMLYASELKKGLIVYANEIIKIEDSYRGGKAEDIYEKWNKLTKNNGVFDKWAQIYNFQSKALTKEQLKEITAEDSSFIFNRFQEILRHNVVSDKSNAFNKIFTLFLCKVYDETRTNKGEELKFQWLEGRDNHVDFQLRLTGLYRKGMSLFLQRTVSDFDDEDFERRCATINDETKRYLRKEINKLRLEKNNEFAIKEVYDSESFYENAKVVKEVVELLQGYRIRYNTRQQYLSDFFELLLTTGLKQEVGQYFTPVPIALFIIKSLPLDDIVHEKLHDKDGKILPYMIDYAAGSGHFITEYMHEVQNILSVCDESIYIDETKTEIEVWKKDHFKWAIDYVYGIEKDYRLVKVGKVGCYLHGDGLANVILSDGLANFQSCNDYKGLLHKPRNDGQRDNQKFDIVLSNPPYSVPSFRQTTRDYYTEQDFELYDCLTDNSKEIECLFVERTKHLLKDGGVAGIILPNTILSNTGIYTKTREIILKYFDIIAIAEFGDGTFMATNTDTVALFLRRRNNYLFENIKEALNKYMLTLNDMTICGIETPVAKYVSHVWKGIGYEDYLSLLRRNPNDRVVYNDIYKEYKSKVSAKTDFDFWDSVLTIEAEKILYFILSYKQQVAIVKSGNKKTEKRFLGYEFSTRRGKEGIHAVQRGKEIDECTSLYDVNQYDNPDKASSYIYKAFKGDYDFVISESMKDHVSRMNLIDMISFDRATFDKSISTTPKKKIKLKQGIMQDSIENYADIIRGVTYSKSDQIYDVSDNIVLTADNITLSGQLEINKKIYLRNDFPVDLEKLLKKDDCFICFSSGSKEHVGKIAYIENDTSYMAGGFMGIIRVNSNKILPKYLYNVLNGTDFRDIIRIESTGSNINNLSSSIGRVKIPVPKMSLQEKIVLEINSIEKTEQIAQEKIEKKRAEINRLFVNAQTQAKNAYRLSDSRLFSLKIGQRVLSSELLITGDIPVISANVFEPFGYTDKLLLTDFEIPSILWGIDGDWMVNYISKHHPFYPTDHCGVLRVLSDEISPKYLSLAIEKAGLAQGFNRSFRASIDRVEGLSILLPDYHIQKEVADKMETLENEVLSLKNIISNSYELKQKVLDKYLL